MALGLAACSPLFARQWIAVELRLMSSSVVPAVGFGIACGDLDLRVPGFLVRNDHEPVFDYWPMTARKGLYRSLLGPDSCVHLRPTTAGVPLASAAIALAMELPESPCLLPAL